MSVYLQTRYVSLILGIVGLYVSTIAIGTNLCAFKHSGHSIKQHEMWKRPSVDTILNVSQKADVVRGQLLFTETPIYRATFAHAKLSCSSCHAEGGIQPFASPVVGISPLFPMYSERAGRLISLKDRVEECIVRSENGTPIGYDSPEMSAIISYIDWLSEPQVGRRPLGGRGLVKIPNLTPDLLHGAEIYTTHCAGCHGANGGGAPYIFPPLWGPDSFSDGAGMNNVSKMAAFVQHNMPQNRMGILTAQEAYDVSSFINKQPRPKFNNAYKRY